MVFLLSARASCNKLTSADYRTAYILNAILTSPTQQMINSLTSKAIIDLLFDYIESSKPKHSLYDQYVGNIFRNVLSKQPVAILEPFSTRQTPSLMVNRFENYPICELFYDIVSTALRVKGISEFIPVCTFPYLFLIKFFY